MIINVFILILQFISLNCIDITTEINLIKDFSKYNSLSRINLVVCWTDSTIVDVVKTLSNYGIKVGRCKDWDIDKCFHGIDFNVGFVAYEHCNGFEDIIHVASKTRKFSGNQFWLIISPNSINVTFWETVNLGVDSDVTYVNTNDVVNNTYVLREIYNTGFENSGVLITNETATWNKDVGIQKYSTQYRTTLRSDLKGLLVNSSVIIVNKFKRQTYLSYVRTHGDMDTITKSQMFVSQYLQELFNFRMHYRRITRWGQLNKKNNTFDGEVGLMQRHLVDVGGNNLYLRLERLPYAHYLGISSYQRSIILFKQPGTLNESVSGFLKPLHWYVWCLTGAVAILTMVLFLLAVIMEYFVIIRKKLEGNTVTSAFLAVISLFCQQSSESTSNITPIRLIIITSTLFSFLLLQFYSASIVSSLLSEPSRIIKDTEDLLHSDLKMRIHNIPYHKASFETTQVQIARVLYAKKCANGTDKNIFVTLEEGIRLVISGGYAFYGDTNDIYGLLRHYNKSQICDLDQIYIIPKDYLYLCTRKQYPLANMLGVGLRRMTERGVLNKETSLWQIERPHCFNQGGRTVPVGIPETKEAFLMLLWGFLLAMLFLIVEMLHWKYLAGKIPFIL